MMKILITTPAPPRSRYGNRVTALRWARILKDLGHHVTVSQAYEDGDYDLRAAAMLRSTVFTDCIRTNRSLSPSPGQTSTTTSNGAKMRARRLKWQRV